MSPPPQTSQIPKTSTLFFPNVPPHCDLTNLLSHHGPLKTLTKCKSYAFATFTFPADADALVAKGGVKMESGQVVKCEYAKHRQRKSTEEKGESTTEDKSKKEERMTSMKRARIIVRNLFFMSKEVNIQNHFKQYGTIKSVNLPMKEDLQKGNKGFAFVEFESIEDAKNAVENANGTKIQGRVIAVDWTLNKTNYKKEVKKNEKLSKVETSDKKTEVKKEDEDSDEQLSEGDAEIKTEELDEDTVVEDNAEDDIEEVSDEDEASIKSEDGEELASEGDMKRKPWSSKETKPTVLFVRNLSYTTDDEALKELFEQFGNVRYAVITRDKDTGCPRGSGFVGMDLPEDAEAALEAAQRGEDSISKNLIKDDGEGLWLDGRGIIVCKALDREEAADLSSNNLTEKRGKDSRNLFLLQEGNIKPGSKASIGMTPQDFSARQMSYLKRKQMLDSNNTYYLSRTRLSIRNLPKKMTNSELKRLVIKAVLHWREHIPTKGRSEEAELKMLKKEGFDDRVEVKQVKIMYESEDRTKSKGWGFVEFSTHAHALGCLRAVDNNPSVFRFLKEDEQKKAEKLKGEDKEATDTADATSKPEGQVKMSKKERKKIFKAQSKTLKAQVEKERRLIVEFSVENKAITKKRETRIVVNQADLKRKREEEDAAEKENKRKEKLLNKGNFVGRILGKKRKIAKGK